MLLIVVRRWETPFPGSRDWKSLANRDPGDGLYLEHPLLLA